MNVLCPQVTILTNAEVYKILNERRCEQGQVPKSQRLKHLGTVLYETSTYLKSTTAPVQSFEDIAKVIKALAPYKLTAAEILQFINMRPVTAIEIQLIVEECEERLTENQVDELVTIAVEYLPQRVEPKSSVDENEKMQTG
ncbi:hypothetical protein AB6A40_008988 [Gnathostoma spinigerum]|uniref:DNA-directed RNA polymerase III subunit RPC9 n=1 Tax=Gnathostoma spinigerum TaxID=75299 RepID=A0ABD6EYF1_9BILA